MSFTVDGTVILLVLIIPLGLLASFVTAPRWCSRSISKHALWHLRDDVVDDVLAGRLPADHIAVQELVVRAEWAIAESRSFDLLHLMVWQRATRHIPTEERRQLAGIPSLHGLDRGAEKLVRKYRERYDRVTIRAMFLSSWLGLAMVLRFGIPAAIDVYRDRRRRGIGAIVYQATDTVATGTALGRSAHDFVTVKGPAWEDHELAPA